MAPSTIGPEPPNMLSNTLPSMVVQGPDSITRALSSIGYTGSGDKRSASFISRDSSTASLASTSDGDEIMIEDGLPHVAGKLHARHYKTQAFAKDLLDIVDKLRVPTWPTAGLVSAENLKIVKVSGSLTNSVFFISYPPLPSVKTLLLRIYGPSSSALISRPRELHILHTLSSKYRIGPKVYGTFANGRAEEYFDSVALTAVQLRDPLISGWIGARMAELHRVEIEAIEGGLKPRTRGRPDWEIAVFKNFRDWLQPAREVLKLPSVDVEFLTALDFDGFLGGWQRYVSWLSTWEKHNDASRRVFAHNDTQYGNLLLLRDFKDEKHAHRKVIVVDFEYSSPNPAAFDIANHFNEWMANYHDENPHILDPSRYPCEKERYNFYRSYLSHSQLNTGGQAGSVDRLSEAAAEVELRSFDSKAAERLESLEAQVRAWRPASHAMWAVWGLVQAREDLELAAQASAKGALPESPEFDYLGYALCRIKLFREDLKGLGLTSPSSETRSGQIHEILLCGHR